MDFGWGAQLFWIVVVTGVVGSIWYAKRHRGD